LIATVADGIPGAALDREKGKGEGGKGKGQIHPFPFNKSTDGNRRSSRDVKIINFAEVVY
jgi:hypothetical protein